MNNEFIDGIWFAVQHIVVVRDMPAIAIGISELLTPKGISFGDCCLFSFPASSCHGFLGHGVGHPPLGSPQA